MLNQSGLLFVPKNWQRADVLRWLKKTHAWTGFWGALIFLLMGTSGFLLNHRAQLKIEAGAPYAVSAMDVVVRPGQFADADALGKWAKSELDLSAEPREPRKEGPASKGRPQFMGKTLPQAEKWTRQFTLVDGRVTVDYLPGSASVSVKHEGQGLLETIKNMHKGTGLGIAWVLFLDTIAGALIVMSLTGFLLWTRLHGPRLLAGAIAGGSLVLAACAVLPNL